MIMKAFISTVLSLFLTVTAFGQTAHDIVTRMDQEMEKHQDEGLELVLDMKLPLLGTTSTKTCILGKNYSMETVINGEAITAWSDGETVWTYTPASNKVEIDKVAVSSTNDNVEMLNGITDGYDVSLTRETDSAWYILCKKSKNNPDKDAPKTMDLVVSKGTYMPVSLTAKVSVITVTLRGMKYGVAPNRVTFNPADYPGVTIIDKR